jgi:hypothetical protein
VDQGIDISAAPGTNILAIANERVTGIIRNWYNGQPFVWFQELGTNTYNYVAEQITNLPQVGQVFQAGEPVAQVAPSGTGLELGYATASGQTLARATTGYTEGQATPAGQAYLENVIYQGKAPATTRSIIVAASTFGGPQDPGTGTTGYQGDDLSQHPDSFAELSKTPSALDFSALGGLPHDAPIVVTNLKTGKTMTLYKRDVGAGGPGLSGHARAIDIWYAAAQQLGISGVELVKVTFPAGSGAAGITRPGGDPATADPSKSQVGSLFGQYLSLRDQPRTAPPNTKNPFSYFMASFTGNWDSLGMPNK